jgi:hypothetical protein
MWYVLQYVLHANRNNEKRKRRQRFDSHFCDQHTQFSEEQRISYMLSE